MKISFLQSPFLRSFGATAFFSFLIVLPLLLLPSPVDSRYLFSINSTAVPPSTSASPPSAPISASPPSAPISASPPSVPISGSPSVAQISGSPVSSPPTGSPANAPGSSASPNAISSLPAPTPGSDDGNSTSPMSPALPPMTYEDERSDERSDETVHSDGGSKVKKVGIAVVVIVATVAVVLGALIYKKRQDNIRRSRYIQAGGLEMR